MKNAFFALCFAVSILLAGYGYVSLNADAPNAQFGQKCGLDKSSEFSKDDFNKESEFSKDDFNKDYELDKDFLGVCIL